MNEAIRVGNPRRIYQLFNASFRKEIPEYRLDACTFIVPSVFRRGDLTVAVSTDGGSPALAKRLRERLEATIGPEYEAFLAALRELREQAQTHIADSAARQALYRTALDSDLFAEVARGDRQAVAARIAALLGCDARKT